MSEEKKENVFSKFWNKAKSAVNESMLESNLERKFEDENDCYCVYKKDDNILSHTDVYGKIENGVLTYLGDEEIPPFSVLVNDKTKKAYYACESNKEGKVVINYDGKDYERQATLIALDENVEEVSVIKAGDRYFVYKGEKN